MENIPRLFLRVHSVLSSNWLLFRSREPVRKIHDERFASKATTTPSQLVAETTAQ